MTTSMGAWSNAPLAYVLAEVRTELIAELKDYFPAIASRLREQFPLQREITGMRLIASPVGITMDPSPATGWELSAPDRRVAIALRPNGLVLHATRYDQGSTEFLPLLEGAVSLFAEVVPAVFINRLGLRYIDFVIPKPGERPESYVAKQLNPDFGISVRPEDFSTMIVSVYPRELGQMTLRYQRGKGQPQLPPDVGGFDLAPSPIMGGADGKSNVPDDQSTAMIDTDRMISFEPVERLDAGRVMGLFRTMHGDISNFFKDNVITPHARKVWNP